MKELNNPMYVMPSSETRFVVVDGNLVECRIAKVILSVHHYENGEPFIKVDSYNIVNDKDLDLLVPAETKFYADFCKFKANESIHADAHNGRSDLTSMIWRGGVGYRSMWYLSDAQANEYDPSEHIKRIAILEGHKGEVIEGFVPDKVYFHKDEVYAWNDITCVDMNGEKYIKEGNLKRLMFNDEQKALMAEFKALTEKMKDAKIRFVYNNGDVQAMNGEHIEEFEYEDYDGSLPCLVKNEFMEDHSFYISADSWDAIFVRFKD